MIFFTVWDISHLATEFARWYSQWEWTQWRLDELGGDKNDGKIGKDVRYHMITTSTTNTIALIFIKKKTLLAN